MSLLSLEVTLVRANRKADDSVSVAFETTTEMSTEQFSFIDGFRKTTGHLVFKKDSIKGTEIPKGDTNAQGETPAQQLRHALYSVWSAKTKQKLITEDWDTYYTNAIMGFKRAVLRSHPDND